MDLAVPAAVLDIHGASPAARPFSKAIRHAEPDHFKGRVALFLMAICAPSRSSSCASDLWLARSALCRGLSLIAAAKSASARGRSPFTRQSSPLTLKISGSVRIEPQHGVVVGDGAVDLVLALVGAGRARPAP